MEYYVLYSYWKKFHEDKAKSLKEIFRNAEKREKVTLSCMIISLVTALITTILLGIEISKFANVCAIILLISYGVEFISVYMFCKYAKEKGIRQIKQNICKIKCGYAEVHKWLKELGYSKKAEIKQFSFRCEELLEQMENEKKQKMNHIEKMIGLFYVPTLLAIISWILGSNAEMYEMGEYVLLVFLLATAGVAIYLAIITIYKVVENSDYSDIRKMKCMIRDFHGVIDYCYDCENDDLELVFFEDKQK